jgi:hypothetical protein
MCQLATRNQRNSKTLSNAHATMSKISRAKQKIIVAKHADAFEIQVQKKLN